MDGGVDVVSIGDVNLDVIFYIKNYPYRGGEVHASKVEYFGGGSAANVAVGLSRLKCKVGLIAAIGDDPLGDKLITSLKEEGVNVSHVRRIKGMSSGLMFVVVDSKGERTIFGVKGANSMLELSDEDEEYASSARALYVSGYVFSGRGRHSILRALRSAKTKGALCFLDVGPLLAREYSNLLPSLSSLVDYWSMNEEEAVELLGSLSNSSMRYFLRRYRGKAVIIRLGGEGAYFYSKAQSFKVPAFRTKVVDTTGAGDAFTVGFMYGILNGYDALKSVKLGNLVASYKVRGRGAWYLPKLEEIRSEIENL